MPNTLPGSDTQRLAEVQNSERFCCYDGVCLMGARPHSPRRRRGPSRSGESPILWPCSPSRAAASHALATRALAASPVGCLPVPFLQFPPPSSLAAPQTRRSLRFFALMVPEARETSRHARVETGQCKDSWSCTRPNVCKTVRRSNRFVLLGAPRTQPQGWYQDSERRCSYPPGPPAATGDTARVVRRHRTR